MVTQFVNNGTDLELLNKSYESMPLEQQEELAKALKKDGLVLVDVQVNGKHGTYTRKQWKKASDVKKDEGKSSNGALDSKDKAGIKQSTDQQKSMPQVIKGKHMSDLKDNLKEHGLVLDGAYGRKIRDDEEVIMYDKDKNAYTAKANVYSDGGVELRGIKKNESVHDVSEDDAIHDIIRELPMFGKTNKESYFGANNRYRINIEQVISGKTDEFMSQRVKDDAIKAVEKCKSHHTDFRLIGNNAREKAKKTAEYCDSIMNRIKDIPVHQTIFEQSTIKSTDFSTLRDISNKDSNKVKLEKEAHNLCVGRLKSEGVNLKDVDAVSKELNRFALELKDKIKNNMTKKEKNHYDDLHNTILIWSDDIVINSKYPSYINSSNVGVPKSHSKSYFSQNKAIEFAKQLHDNGATNIEISLAQDGEYQTQYRVAWDKEEKKEETVPDNGNNKKQDNSSNPYPDYVNKTNVGVPKTYSSIHFKEENAIKFAKQLHDSGNTTNIEISSSVNKWGQTQYQVAWDDKEEKEQSNTKADNKPAKSSAPLKAKQDSSPAVSVPKTKADIQSMLASGKSRNDIIELAKKSGISWKENDHEGINWMRCCMALTASNKINAVQKDTNNDKPTVSVAPKDIPSRSNPVFLGDNLTKRIKRNPEDTGVFQVGKDSFIVDNGQIYHDTYTRTEFISKFGIDPMSSKKAIKATDEEWAAGEKYHKTKSKESK